MAAKPQVGVLMWSLLKIDNLYFMNDMFLCLMQLRLVSICLLATT